jgi:dTDP-4-dehydrorhamnose reductase
MDKSMVLVTGATGLLGSVLVPLLRSYGKTVVTHAHHSQADHSFNLTDKHQTAALLEELRPKSVINLAGLTSVERCQEQPNESYLINTRIVEHLASWIRQSGTDCHLVQISTDQVYDGVGPHTEEMVTLTNNYAFSKYAGELAASQVSSTILRTNFVGRSKIRTRESLTDWVYNSLMGRKHVRVLNDVYFSPLSMTTLIELINLVIERKPLGVFNLGSHNGMTKADFDFAFAECLNLPTAFMTRIDTSQATFLKAYRPKDMRMDCSKFEATLRVKLPDLMDELRSVAGDYDEVA